MALAALPRHRVQFLFDVISPYSYLGFRALRRYEKVWDLEVEWQPVFLGGVMKGAGNKPPAMVPNKAKFMSQDLQRNQAFFDVPCNVTPGNFFTVAGDLRMMRVLCCAKETQAPGVALAMYERAFETYWGALRPEPDSITVDDDVIAGICTGAGVEDVDDFLAQAYGSDNKKRLIEVTNAAVDRGVFGAPTMFVWKKGSILDDDEPAMFFGADRFEQMAFHLGETWCGPRGPLASAL